MASESDDTNRRPIPERQKRLIERFLEEYGHKSNRGIEAMTGGEISRETAGRWKRGSYRGPLNDDTAVFLKKFLDDRLADRGDELVEPDG